MEDVEGFHLVEHEFCFFFNPKVTFVCFVISAAAVCCLLYVTSVFYGFSHMLRCKRRKDSGLMEYMHPINGLLGKKLGVFIRFLIIR